MYNKEMIHKDSFIKCFQILLFHVIDKKLNSSQCISIYIIKQSNQQVNV